MSTGMITLDSPPRWADQPVHERSSYLPGLDGLRAVSVLAVLAYHLDAGWAVGGYLGVEVFFVISGFLITGMLLGEHAATGKVDLLAFWRRRARRLLPAVVVLVVAVTAWGGLVLPDGELQRFRGDAVAGLLYVQNWHAVIADQPYFAAFGRPSPLRHLWSLAIEEQFYLLWPLALPLALRLGRRRAAVAVSAAALASVAVMATTADIAAPERAYYGTDTRLFGLLAGALLAWAWRPSRWRSPVSTGARRTVESVGVLALLLLGQQFVVRSEFDPWTFPWGFVWVDVLTVVAIVAATHPSSRLAALVGAGWMQVIGRRSYSIYLWHWPVIVCTRPGVDWPLDGAVALAARVLLIGALSEASYRFVEQPFRDGRVTTWLDSRMPEHLERRRPPVLAGAAATVAFVGILAIAPDGGVVQSSSSVRISTGITLGPLEGPTTTATPTTAAPTTTSGTAVGAAKPAPAPAATVPPPSTLPPPVVDPAAVKQVTVIGESVTLGAFPELQAYYGDRMQMDAVEGRSFEDGIRLIEGLAAHGRLTPWVVVHIGNNGAAPPGGLDRIVAAVGPQRRLILVNVRVPRRWEEQVNGEIARVARQHPHVVLANWWKLTHDEPGLLVDDGVHLTRQGRIRYRDLLVAVTS